MASRPKGYGLTAELEAKVVCVCMYLSTFVNVRSEYPFTQKAAKYDDNLAAEAVAWIEEITGEAIDGSSPDSIQESLKDGVILCK